MRNKKYAARAIVATLAVGLALGTATMASADTWGFTRNVSTSGSWTIVPETKTSISTTVAFTPNNLLYQAGPENFLSLRMRTPGDGALSASVSWNNSYTQKSLMTGLPSGTPFRLSACCYSSVGGDASWGGTLSY